MTAFLRNCWYVAGEAHELQEKPFARTILGTPILFYRKSDGTPVALHDRCPHRFVELSLGKRIGDDVQCIYHGLRFGPDGRCVHNPHDRSVSGRMRISAFPLVERYGYVWIWPGVPALADSSLLPELPFLEDEDHFRSVRGYLPIEANYQLVIDNLLDLSHVEFLHPMFAREEGVAGHRLETVQGERSVTSNRWKPDQSLNAFAKLFWDLPDECGDGRANMTWTAPSTLLFDLGVCRVGDDPAQGVCTPAAHLLTPETARRTHYFWAQARNRRLDDATLDDQLHKATSRVFEEEEKLVIESQQRAMGEETDLLKLKPLLLKSDTPTVMARRILDRLIVEEAGEGAETMVAAGAMQ